MDFSLNSEDFFKIAEANLFQLYHQYLGSGETTSSDPFWWPATTRLFYIGVANGFIQPDDLRLGDHIDQAILFSQQGPLIVRMRVAYWLHKLMTELEMVPPGGIYDGLKNIDQEFHTDSNVYAMLHSSYLLELNNSHKIGDKNELIQQFKDRLERSSQSTKKFFEKCEINDQILPGTLLRFNYT